MINTQYINLNMIPSGVMPVLYCSQYDIGRPLGMVVYNGGEAVDMDTYTCTIEATRTDGTAITAAVTTDDNIGAFVTTATMTNKADMYPAKLVLFDSNSRRVASLAFMMCVTKATMDENAESIEEDASLYQQYTGTVQTLIAEIRTDIQRIEDERPYVSPEMYGAYGDGVHDDSTAIQSAINASLTNGIRLLAKGKTYLVGTGLRIVGSRNASTREVETGNDIDIDFSTSTIRYTGTDYAFTLSMINKGWFRFGSIDAASGGGILMQSDSIFNYISYLNISGGSIAANAAKDCITVTNSGTGWTNQNRIENILFKSGLYAVHMISNSTNKINEWIIENVALEGVENGHYLEAHSEIDITVYIESIKFLYNRAVEHIGNGKTFLKTYGRVQDILVESYYGSFQLPAAYDFSYDTSGMQTYTHIASKVEIVSQNAKCKVVNGKFISNPFMYDGACAITHISSISDAADVAYRNYYGTLKEFADAGVMPYYGLLSNSTEANLNTRWLAGSPTDIEANKRLEQTLYTRAGTAFKRGFINYTFSDWLMSPMVKTERKQLHQKTFSLDINAWGLLVISTLSLSYVEAYFVRFGTTNAPVKLFTSNPSMTQWTLTRPNEQSVYFENTSFPSNELFVSFLQLG